MIRNFLSTIFINIIKINDSYHIKSYSVKNKKIRKIYEKYFNINDINIQKYINFLSQQHYFYYVSYMFQGEQDLVLNNITNNEYNIKQIDNFYIKILKKDLSIFNNLKIDLLYSPFMILHKLMSNIIYTKTTLLALINENYLTIVISDKTIKFAKHINLNNINNIDEYLNDFLKEYYTNENYDSNFIENIIIYEFNTQKLNIQNQLKKILLIEPKIIKLDIFEIMLQLISIDLGVKIEI